MSEQVKQERTYEQISKELEDTNPFMLIDKVSYEALKAENARLQGECEGYRENEKSALGKLAALKASHRDAINLLEKLTGRVAFANLTNENFREAQRILNNAESLT